MRGIVKVFPGVRALDGADLEVAAGEIHGLVGKNGAGKSTLVSILVGMTPPDEGRIVIDGREYSEMTPRRAKDSGIAIVPQHAQLLPALTVAENILCGRLPTRRFGFVDWRRAYREAEQRLGTVGLDVDVRRDVAGLSVAERQLIDIAKALFAQARVVVLDEPTAPLPKHEVEKLFTFVRQQRARGTTFVYISHYLSEVFELCDSVTVLRDGTVVRRCSIEDVDTADLVRMISGRQQERVLRHHGPGHGASRGRPVLEISGLSRPGAYQDVRMTVHAGEIVGLTGLEGSGTAALGRGLFGLEPMGRGEVRLGGTPYRVRSPVEALRRKLAYLPRDRHGLGIVGVRSVAENMTLPILRDLTHRFGFLHRRRERDLVERFVDRLEIKTPSIDQPIEFLSGGNQQKVIAARLVAVEPTVLFLDEPTQGVDVQAKAEILRIVLELAEEGLAVVVISDEIQELLDICDRILVMDRGRMVAQFTPGDPSATEHNVRLAIEGGVPA